MSGKRLKEKLTAGEPVFGTFFQYTTNPAVVQILPTRGLDFVIVNTEHNHLDLADFLPLAWALRARDIACLVRLHNRDADDVARACDAFPDGVVVPYVEDAAELRRLVAAAKCRPLKGAALEQVLAGGDFPSPKSRAYIDDKCANTFFCAMIESVHAVENLEAICAVPGIDALLIGPNDLTVSMGIPEERDHPDFVRMTQRIIDMAAARGIAAGAHFSQLDHAKRLIAQGARFIPFSSDLRLLQRGIPEFLDALGAAAGMSKEQPI